MSKDREQVADDSLDPAIGADDATDAFTESAELTDPENDAPNAVDIAAEIAAAESAEGLAAGSSDDDLGDDDDLADDDLADDDLADSDLVDDELTDDETIDADAELASVGAGSNRAKARQAAAARAGVTAKKDAPTRARDTSLDREGNPISRLGRFLREVVAELRKVIWPSQKQMVTYTLVVIAFLIFMVALVAGLDVLFHLVVGKVFS